MILTATNCPLTFLTAAISTVSPLTKDEQGTVCILIMLLADIGDAGALHAVEAVIIQVAPCYKVMDEPLIFVMVPA